MTFDDIPVGKMTNGEGLPLGEVAILAVHKETKISQKTGNEYIVTTAEIMLPTGEKKTVRAAGVIGKQLSGLESVPCRIRVEERVSKTTGRTYRTIST